MSVSGKKTIDLPKNVVVHKNEVVSIRSLLIFLNNTLDCELRGMDDLKTGAVYCQLMHRLYPETIPIQKVRFYTSSTSDFKANFRLLQNSIEKLRVTRYMSEDELIAGHNHVDFCNWMHKFFKTNDNKKEYDAKKVRKGSPIGLNKILNVAPSSTGGMNAMHKCQSMVFNYTKNAAKLERRNSLDIRASKTGIFKNIQREKQTKEPNPKPSKTKKISKTSHFLDESKNVSLPSESEDELERLVPNRNNVKKVHGTQSSTPGIPRQGPEIQVKCGSPLCKRYNQEAGDQQSKLHTVDNLERQLERLQIDNEILTKKLEAVEYLLMKYYNKPDIAVSELNTFFQKNPKMVEVPPRTSIDTCNVEGSAKDKMPPRHSEQFQTCVEFSPHSLKDKGPSRLHSGCDEHTLPFRYNSQSSGSGNMLRKRVKVHCKSCGGECNLYPSKCTTSKHKNG